jgi:hypothetical protein
MGLMKERASEADRLPRLLPISFRGGRSTLGAVAALGPAAGAPRAVVVAAMSENISGIAIPTVPLLP